MSSAIFAQSETNDLQLQVPIPTESGSLAETIPLCGKDTNGATEECSGILLYISYVYRWLIIAVAVIAVLAIIYAGFLWITSRGQESQSAQAKTVLSDALVAIVLTLGSYTLLWLVDPNLTRWRPLTLEQIPTIEIPHASIVTELASNTGTGDNCSSSDEIESFISSRSLILQCVGTSTCAAQRSGMWTQGIKGQGSVPVDPRILCALKHIAQDCPGTTVTALNEQGGHSSGSYHYIGKAVDVGGSICGAAPDVCNPKQRAIVTKLIGMGYNVGTPGGRCGGFSDYAGHFHIGVK